MKKTTKPNPLKYFNDAAASRKKSVTTGNDKLMKAQNGTAFQAYLKNVPDAAASDTLAQKDPRGQTLFGWKDHNKEKALASAFQSTYGKTHGYDIAGEGPEVEKAARIPQTKKTVKAYTKSIANPEKLQNTESYSRKKGGAVKTKKK